jgi:shikimate dehydrogenase
VISAATRLYAVIGDPIAHSLSPLMQNWFIKQFNLDAVYAAFHVKNKDLQACVNGVRAVGISGVNVTVPHKEAILPFVDSESEQVKLLGAANTLANDNGKITAHVTDPYGFIESLGQHKSRFAGASVLLFGAGGAAKSVAYALSQLGVGQLLISDLISQKAVELAKRAKAFGLKDATALEPPLTPIKEIIKHTPIIINATAVGMHPNEAKSVVTHYDIVGPQHFFYDLVYNPSKTTFLRLAEQQGATIQNGLNMLIFQGLQSLRIWTGEDLLLSPSQLNELQAIMRKKLRFDE